MDSKTYRKLRKLVTKPRLYFKDARLKRQHPKIGQYNTGLSEAKALFKQGDILAVEERLPSVPDTLAQKTVFSASVALFAKRYAEAERYAFSAMQTAKPSTSLFREAFYFHQEALRFQGRFESALTMLKGMPFDDNSARYFRAWRLASIGAKCPEAFESIMIRHTPGDPGWLRSRNHYILLLRDLQLGERAIAEAKFLMQQVELEPVGQPKARPPRTDSQKKRWQGKAGLALTQLKEDLAQYDINFFLVSGTLLGCVREGTILGHDTDIDVGVMPEVTMKSLRNAIKHSSRFKLQEIISENTLYVMHPNGVKIDLFRHYEENGKFYHGGIKCRWWNTPFSLKETEFLNKKYYIPNNCDMYLTENYGDWRSRVTEFETFLDTLNIEVTSSLAMSLYYISRYIELYRNGNLRSLERFRSKLDTPQIIFLKLKSKGFNVGNWVRIMESVRELLKNYPRSYRKGLTPYHKKNRVWQDIYFKKPVAKTKTMLELILNFACSVFVIKSSNLRKKASRMRCFFLNPAQTQCSKQYKQALYHFKKMGTIKHIANQQDIHLAALQIVAIEANYQKVFFLIDLAEKAIGSIKSCKKIMAYIHQFACEAALMSGEQSKIDYSLKLLGKKNPFYYYYYSITKYYMGDTSEALSELQMMQNMNSDPDVSYLMARMLVDIGERNAAWEVLENVLNYSRRTATLKYLADLVNDKGQLASYLVLLNRWCEKNPSTRYHREVSISAAKAARLAGNYRLANKIIHDCIYNYINRNDSVVKVSSKETEYFIEEGLPQWRAPCALVLHNVLLKNREGRLWQALKALMEMANFRGANLVALQETVQWLLKGVGALPTSEMKFCISYNDKTTIFFEDLKFRSFFEITKKSKNLIRLKHSNGIEVIIFLLIDNFDFIEYSHKGLLYRHYDFDSRAITKQSYDVYVPKNLNLYYKESGVSRKKQVVDWVLESNKKVIVNKSELILHAYECLLKGFVQKNKQLVDLSQKTLRNLNEVTQPYQKVIYRYSIPNSKAILKDRIEVILYVSGLKQIAHQVNMWIPVLERLEKRSAIVIREKEIAENLIETTIPIYFIKTALDLKLLNNGLIKKVLYLANTKKNIHMLKFNNLEHCFINHIENNKSINKNKFLMAYDKLLVAGLFAEKRLRDSRLPIMGNQIVHVGRPQVEINLQQMTAPTTKIKTILYAPTWESFIEKENYSSVNKFGLTLLNRLSEYRNIKLFFKPHPYTGYNKKKKCNYFLDKMKEVCSENNNLVFVSDNVDISELMNKADLLITDVSSILNDFLYTLKPIVLTNPRLQKEELLVSLFPSSKAAYILNAAGEIGDVINKIKLNDLNKFPERTEVCHYFLGDPAVSYIEKFNQVVSRDGF